MTPLESWNQSWHMAADHLECVHCKNCQWPWNSNQPFRHEPGCPIEGSVQYPWQELAEILRSKSY